MKKLVYCFSIIVFILGCSTSKPIATTKEVPNKTSDTIRIANDELEYEIIIIDASFNSWLNSRAQPRGYYSESYLENRNKFFVAEWNNRVLQPQIYDSKLYEMQINYNPTIHYGYEVNYLLYNYLIYFQITNKQQLSGFVPRP
jgi:hypothetical protein